VEEIGEEIGSFCYFCVVVSEMSHKTDNNGFKKGTDFGFFYPFISAIRCCFVV